MQFPDAGRSSEGLWGCEEKLVLLLAVHRQLQDKAQAEAEEIMGRWEQERSSYNWLQPLIPHPSNLLREEEEVEELEKNG